MKHLIASLIVFLCLYSGAQTTRYYQVILRSDVGEITLWDGTIIPAYGFSPLLSQPISVPGYTIYAEEGDTVIITARSVSQGAHHTIHLHGLDVDTRNDGDPATSFYLEHMQDTDYTFIATHAGTYIYHCHVADVVHVQMGMYGSVIVSAAGGAAQAWTGGPAFDKEYNWLLTEVDTAWHYDPPEHDVNTDTFSIPPYTPQYFLINGISDTMLASNSGTHIKGAVGEKIYMRLANIMYTDNKFYFPSSLNAEIIDSDGRPLPNSVFSDTLVVSPGERYGVMLTPSAEMYGSIAVEYINMNTFQVLNTQYAPVTIEGFAGIKENTGEKFSVHPNPATDIVTLKIPEGTQDCLVQVYSPEGKLIQEDQYNTHGNKNLQLDLGKLNTGIYYIQVTAGLNIFSEKIILIK